MQKFSASRFGSADLPRCRISASLFGSVDFSVIGFRTLRCISVIQQAVEFLHPNRLDTTDNCDLTLTIKLTPLNTEDFYWMSLLVGENLDFHNDHSAGSDKHASGWQKMLKLEKPILVWNALYPSLGLTVISFFVSFRPFGWSLRIIF